MIHTRTKVYKKYVLLPVSIFRYLYRLQHSRIDALSFPTVYATITAYTKFFRVDISRTNKIT